MKGQALPPHLKPPEQQGRPDTGRGPREHHERWGTRPAGSADEANWTRPSDHDTPPGLSRRQPRVPFPPRRAGRGQGQGLGRPPSAHRVGEGLPRTGQARHCAAVPRPARARPSRQNARPEQHSPRLIQAEARGAAPLLPARLPAHAPWDAGVRAHGPGPCRPRGLSRDSHFGLAERGLVPVGEGG